MRRLQLYIGTERVDLFKDETVSLTQTIKNVKDLAKVFTEFTQTFSVPASRVTIRYLNTIITLILVVVLMQEKKQQQE